MFLCAIVVIFHLLIGGSFPQDREKALHLGPQYLRERSGSQQRVRQRETVRLAGCFIIIGISRTVSQRAKHDETTGGTHGFTLRPMGTDPVEAP